MIGGVISHWAAKSIPIVIPTDLYVITIPTGKIPSQLENNATLYRTQKHCRAQNRPKIGEEGTKNRIWALFRLKVYRGPAGSQIATKFLT